MMRPQTFLRAVIALGAESVIVTSPYFEKIRHTPPPRGYFVTRAACAANVRRLDMDFVERLRARVATWGNGIAMNTIKRHKFLPPRERIELALERVGRDHILYMRDIEKIAEGWAKRCSGQWRATLKAVVGEYSWASPNHPAIVKGRWVAHKYYCVLFGPFVKIAVDGPVCPLKLNSTQLQNQFPKGCHFCKVAPCWCSKMPNTRRIKEYQRLIPLSKRYAAIKAEMLPLIAMVDFLDQAAKADKGRRAKTAHFFKRFKQQGR